MNWKKWKIGFGVAILFGLLSGGAGLAAGMTWQAFAAVLCTSLATHLGAYLMKHPVDAVQDDTPPSPPTRLGVWTWALGLSAALLLTACATRWIDKVAQARASATKVAYRAGAEYNAWLQPRTNNPAAYGTTYFALMTQWTNVDQAARQVGHSALLVESLEDAYRAAPTNQSALGAAVTALANQSSNLNLIVKGIIAP